MKSINSQLFIGKNSAAPKRWSKYTTAAHPKHWSKSSFSSKYTTAAHPKHWSKSSFSAVFLVRRFFGGGVQLMASKMDSKTVYKEHPQNCLFWGILGFRGRFRGCLEKGGVNTPKNVGYETVTVVFSFVRFSDLS